LKKNLSIIDNFSASKLVMKPIYGAQWVWVSLVEKDAIYDLSRRETIQSYSDYVIQDFVDFSWGIPWIVDGIHDVRLVVFGKKVVYVLIRVPHGSDFRCNISQDGGYFFIDFADLPMSMQQDALIIIDRLNLFTGWEKYAYSVDIALWVDGKTYLIEFNSAIGLKHLVPAFSSAYADRYLQGIFSLFETD
jgi:glutathione synthase/RimK-type ligase-like ATP-grasp enzyme